MVPAGPVTVIDADWIGADALTLTYGDGGSAGCSPGERMLSRGVKVAALRSFRRTLFGFSPITRP